MFGYLTSGGAKGVGTSTTKAVVLSAIQYLLQTIFYLQYL